MLVIWIATPIFAALIVAIVKIHLETNREIKEEQFERTNKKL